MKKFAEQFKKRSEKLRLSSYERNELRERLLSYMEYHPLPGGVGSTSDYVKSKKRFSVSINGWLVGRFAGVAAVLVFVVVPVMAEDALPGDTLYPIKVRFNEELRGAMVSSPYQKVEWETERLERRLAEADLLADSGRLTPDAEADVAEAIKQHSEAAREGIASIRATDNDEATLAEISLTSTLQVSAEILTKKGSSDSATSSVLFGAVNKAATTQLSGSTVSYEKILSRIEVETTRAYEYLNSLGNVASPEQKSDIERRLNDVKTKVESANKLKEQDKAGATLLLTEALSNTQKLISFMTKLEVRENVTIEDLVPIVPTDEEKFNAMQLNLSNASTTIAMVETGLKQLKPSSNDYIAIADTISQYRLIEIEAKRYLTAGELKKAEALILEILEIVKALEDTMVGLGIDLEAEETGEKGT
ncbi:hypothetical protein H6788_01340 [Candidatus Nomurabacteria bacterium]|nr:hypothetical protein [Candidatus Nomurabacteria bacterium]